MPYWWKYIVSYVLSPITPLFFTFKPILSFSYSSTCFAILKIINQFEFGWSFLCRIISLCIYSYSPRANNVSQMFLNVPKAWCKAYGCYAVPACVLASDSQRGTFPKISSCWVDPYQVNIQLLLKKIGKCESIHKY